MHNSMNIPIGKSRKLISSEEAAALVRSGDTLATGGFVGIGFAEELAIALKNRFVATAEPRDLTLLFAAGQGDGKSRGLNHLAHEGLLKRVIGGHWGLAPKLQELANQDKIEAYNLPQGVISHMFRDISAHRPRTITRAGIGTFVDPRVGGYKLNSVTTEELVEVLQFDGREYLAYRPIPVQVAFLRGSIADSKGNISLEREALTLETLAIAMAARNSGGKVIFQVEKIVERGGIPSRQVSVPGILVDYLVVSKPENHMQTFENPYRPELCGKAVAQTSSGRQMPLDERKIIARRAALELRRDIVVNLGIGMPEGVAQVANEEEIFDQMTLTTEPGVIGGIPTGGLSFGAGVNSDAMLDQPNQFDFYDGGGLDIAFLGMAQVDAAGNVNVSRFGPKLAGAGGFINISANTRKVVFLGTFTAGKFKAAVKNGSLEILQEGNQKKFVGHLDHVTFSAAQALKEGRTILYVTERCAFELTEKGLELVEVAPGIDLEKDILTNMDFRPAIRSPLRVMDTRIFRPGQMGLAKSVIGT